MHVLLGDGLLFEHVRIMSHLNICQDGALVLLLQLSVNLAEQVTPIGLVILFN